MSFSLYYYYVFSMPSADEIVVPEQKKNESPYLESYKLQVTALVPEFLGAKYFLTGSGKKYLVVFGNTPVVMW